MNAKATPALLVVLIAAIAVSTWLITENQNKHNDLLGELLAHLETTEKPTALDPIQQQVVQADPPAIEPKLKTPEPTAEDPPIVTEVVVTESQPEAVVADTTDTTETTTEATPEPVVDAVVPGSNPGEVLWQQYGATIEQIITDLMAGRDEAVTKRFSKEYARKLASAEIDMSATMQRMREQNGALLRITSHQLLDFPLAPGQSAFRVTTVTENNPSYVFTITINDQKLVEAIMAR